jgi:AraC family transcriptional regulator of adaptative response/methylated-DNA-[protein]-cysteine methyltransferase
MGMALRTLRNDHDLASARRRSGYESESGFAAAFASIFGLPPRRGSDVPDPARARWFPTPLGPMVAIANDAGLLLLEFHDRRALATEIEWVQRHVGSGIVPGNSSILEQIEAEMIEYFAGRLREFATPLVAAGSPFQLRVWAELRRIPYGETRSYSQIAPSIGSPGAVRAVGKANGDNRLGVIIPCHRVIRADGELCGYGGGIWRKQKLLELEAAMPQSTLFDQRARQV